MRALALIAAIALSAPAASAARPGTLDPSFGGDGRVTTKVPGGRTAVAGIEALPGGKLLLTGTVGDSTVVLIRYRRDGTLDRRFGHSGVRRYAFDRDVAARDMAIDGQGRILLSGALGPDAVVLRFDRGGRPDSTFDGDGIASVDFGGADDATAIALTPDGRIVMAAAIGLSDSADLGVARLDASGHVEAGFGESGVVRLRHHNGEDRIAPVAVAIFPDDRVAVGVNYSSPKGNAPFVMRLGANGAPDATFGQDVGVPGWQTLRGIVGIDEAYVGDLALRSKTGQLLATGSGYPRSGRQSLWLADAGAASTPGVVSLGLIAGLGHPARVRRRGTHPGSRRHPPGEGPRGVREHGGARHGRRAIRPQCAPDLVLRPRWSGTRDVPWPKVERPCAGGPARPGRGRRGRARLDLPARAPAQRALLAALEVRVQLVVVAGVRRVDLHDRLQPGRRVERARGDADRVAVGRFPEQARAALAAEAPARVRVALRAVDPAQAILAGQPQRLTRRRRVGARDSRASDGTRRSGRRSRRAAAHPPRTHRPAEAAAVQPTSASSRPCSRSRPRCTAAMNFVRLTSSVLRMSSA